MSRAEQTLHQKLETVADSISHTIKAINDILDNPIEKGISTERLKVVVSMMENLKGHVKANLIDTEVLMQYVRTDINGSSVLEGEQVRPMKERELYFMVQRRYLREEFHSSESV